MSRTWGFKTIHLAFFFVFLASLCEALQPFLDAPFKSPEKVYKDAMECPRGISNKTGGIVFLVHGAATTGTKTWSGSPFNEQLANSGQGYDVCWVNLPWVGLGDLQESAEYVAFGIKYFSSLSHASGNKINVIGHSQGAGANVPFWPSIQPLILNYFAIAGTFKGPVEAEPMCWLENLWGGCLPSPLQLKPNSRYMKAQNSEADEYSGSKAHVKTISIYSIYDQILQWEGKKGVIVHRPLGGKLLTLRGPPCCPSNLRSCAEKAILWDTCEGIVEDLATLKIIQAIIPSGDPISNELEKFDSGEYCKAKPKLYFLKCFISVHLFAESSCQHLGKFGLEINNLNLSLILMGRITYYTFSPIKLEGLWLKVLSRWKYILNVGKSFAIGPGRLHKIFNHYAHLRTVKEPGLQVEFEVMELMISYDYFWQSYVCERGYATDCLPPDAMFPDLRE
ncbi:hypothetical protein VP01_2079g1 [Puccinia sorghi]|uniref:Triacylglycerol lipase n=1 Tax=Puccinia sorghi TaxID=27349 RepID=A0A0L6VC94_9BASI|nr:hypothetical protein VP01_2079g1 [Puccinia sorghi]